MRAILGSDLPFEVVSQKLDLPELQVREQAAHTDRQSGTMMM